MESDSLRAHLHAAPFKPFDLHLSDGRRLTVKHPELVAFAPSRREIFLWTSEHSHEFVDLDQVTSLAINRRPAANA